MRTNATAAKANSALKAPGLHTIVDAQKRNQSRRNQSKMLPIMIIVLPAVTYSPSQHLRRADGSYLLTKPTPAYAYYGPPVGDALSGVW
jgi:hypothetical protein